MASAFVLRYFDNFEDFMQIYSVSLIHVVTFACFRCDISFARDEKQYSESSKVERKKSQRLTLEFLSLRLSYLF